MVAVIDHIIEALRRDTVVLGFLERNFVWPGLDQIEASSEAEPLMRKLLNVVLTSPEMAGRSEREVYQRITALGSSVHVGVLFQHSGGQAGQHRRHETGTVRHHPQGAVRNIHEKIAKSLAIRAKAVVNYPSRYDVWTVSSAGRASA